jgi:phosphatidylinositol-4,5-bisphosphate 3-kinase
MMSGPSFIDNITEKININAIFKGWSERAKELYPKEGGQKVNIEIKKLIKDRFKEGVCKFELPIHPSYCASGFEFSKLRVFSSKMVPIALNLYSSEGETFRVIFKIGDDLRQDSMILQIFKIMDKIWLENDLDLKLSIYNVCPLELKCGFMEFVEGTPLEEVQKKENDLGGALDKELLYKYLNNLSNEISKNKDGLPLDKELDNFIRSLAGYCVATGVLGIADRHPANVMIKENGIFFHIDFGHIFGNFKTKWFFKRERSLFLLTPDMAYVYTKSNNKKIFINYCTNAFNILRRNAQRLLNITITMSSSNMPEFSAMADVKYFRDMLKLELINEEEASDYFIRLIKQTINDKYRIIDNLIHNCVHP